MSVRSYLALVVVVLCLVTSCATRVPVAIEEAETSVGSSRVQVFVPTCQGNPKVAMLQERSDEVRFRVVADEQTGDNLDCADGVVLELLEPLGSRALVDDTSGARVPVRDTAGP